MQHFIREQKQEILDRRGGKQRALDLDEEREVFVDYMKDVLTKGDISDKVSKKLRITDADAKIEQIAKRIEGTLFKSYAESQKMAKLKKQSLKTIY